MIPEYREGDLGLPTKEPQSDLGVPPKMALKVKSGVTMRDPRVTLGNPGVNLRLLWESFEGTLVLLSGYTEVTFWVPWDHFGGTQWSSTTLRVLWDHFGFTFETTLAVLWGHFEGTL